MKALLRLYACAARVLNDEGVVLFEGLVLSLLASE
jgi:hypothetical protein